MIHIFWKCVSIILRSCDCSIQLEIVLEILEPYIVGVKEIGEVSVWESIEGFKTFEQLINDSYHTNWVRRALA